MSISLQVVKRDPRAQLPAKADNDPENAGYDLCALLDEPVILKPLQRKPIDTGLSFAVPTGYYGRIAPRSGLAVKHGLDVLAGVIDENYRGPVKVVLVNLSDEDFEIPNGMRIAQLIIQPCLHLDVQEVAELRKTRRGEGGFGSTGA